MFKKVVAFLTIIFILAVLGVSSFATNDSVLKAKENELKEAQQKLENIIKSKDTEPTDQFLIKITSPVGDKASFEKWVLFLGFSTKKDISVNILVYDEESESYVNYEDPDDPNFGSWDMPDAYTSFKRYIQFAKDIKIRVVSYVKSEIKELEPGKNLQINDFTFKLLKEPSRGNKSMGFTEYSDMVNGIK